jgi:hypothetical protein
MGQRRLQCISRIFKEIHAPQFANHSGRKVNPEAGVEQEGERPFGRLLR